MAKVYTLIGTDQHSASAYVVGVFDSLSVAKKQLKKLVYESPYVDDYELYALSSVVLNSPDTEETLFEVNNDQIKVLRQRKEKWDATNFRAS